MAEEPMVALAIIGLVVLAAVLQRITGIGFAMMMAPFLVVMVGPYGGVMLTNILSLLAPLLMIPVVWKDIEWKKLAWLAPASVAAMPICGWLAAISPEGPLYIVVASLVILGLSISMVLNRVNRQFDGPATRIFSGLGAGGGVVLAGVGGPAMTVYAVVSRWDVVKFAATIQPLWILLACGGFLTNLSFSGSEFPTFRWWFWVGSLVAILGGMHIGARIRSRVSEPMVRRAVIVLAFIGASLSLATGLRTTIGA